MAARVFVVSLPWVKVKSNGVSLGHAIATHPLWPPTSAFSGLLE
jgi:hypothetical protein